MHDAPGKLQQNGYVERLRDARLRRNGRTRHECLNETLFVPLAQACSVLRAWRADDNHRGGRSCFSQAATQRSIQPDGLHR